MVRLQPEAGTKIEQLDRAGVIRGDLVLAAQRAWTWTDRPEAGPVLRVVLEGSPTLQLGGTVLNCDRAVVWITPASDAQGPVWDVLAYLENAESLFASAQTAVSGDRLFVRAVIRAPGGPSLRADLRFDGPPEKRGDASASGEVLERAEQALRLSLAAAPSPGLSRRDRFGDRFGVEDDSAARALELATRRPAGRNAPESKTDPIFTASGSFYIVPGDRVIVESGEDENVVKAFGGVVVQYTDRREGRNLELAAERAVVFLGPGPLDEQLSGLAAGRVRGIYLEGDVRATDGEYAIRSPNAYYDVEHDQALLVDAVFTTYSEVVGAPLYVRADAVRQESADRFSTGRTRMSNVAFAEPALSLGAASMVIEQRRYPSGASYTQLDARHLTLRAGDIPFFYWPIFSGDPERFPIRGLAFENSNRTGPAIRSRYDLWSLLGMAPRENIQSLVDIDYYSERGFGLGTSTRWGGEVFDRDHRGSFFAYILPSDDGVGVLPNGTERDADGDTRGVAQLEERVALSERWDLLARGFWSSDAAFLPEFFPTLSTSTVELTNALELRRQGDRSLLWFEVEALGTSFVPTEHQLRAPGYAVDRLPQASYAMLNIDLLAESAPGLLTYQWEGSLAQLRLRFSEDEARSIGLTSPFSSRLALGIEPDESPGDRLRAAGLDEELTLRFDTRHELRADLEIPVGDAGGSIHLTPFVVGRVTAYDRDFGDFRDATGSDASDEYRVWGAAGVTLSTEIVREYNGVNSRALDLHRLRHVIEPSVTLWHGRSNLSRGDVPVFDDAVENIADGTITRFGLDQRLQTKRGGPGQWRSVDWLRLDLAYVSTSEDRPEDDYIGRFDAARPELTVPGEYITALGSWRATEALTIAGETIVDVESSRELRSSLGVLLRHSPTFETSAELRYLGTEDVTYGYLTASYQLTSKYTVVGRANYNFDQQDFDTFSAGLSRAFPNLVLRVDFAYDNIRGDTSFGFNVMPVGLLPSSWQSR